MEKNENIISIKGKANIPQELTLGKQYDLTASAECSDYKVVDNENGTCDYIYTLKLLGEVNIISEKELIKAEVKKSSMASVLRLFIRDWWMKEGEGQELEDFYKEKMTEIIDGVKNRL